MIRETKNLTSSSAFVEQPTARDVENSRPLHRRIAELPDDSGEKAFRSKLPDDSGETMPDKRNLRSFNERKPGDLTEEEIKTLQERADQVAREYNDKFSPYERACAKGIEGVTKTSNGGVSFENSNALYVAEDGKKGVVTIEATGNRSADFDKANKELGLPEKPDGYTWSLFGMKLIIRPSPIPAVAPNMMPSMVPAIIRQKNSNGRMLEYGVSYQSTAP